MNVEVSQAGDRLGVFALCLSILLALPAVGADRATQQALARNPGLQRAPGSILVRFKPNTPRATRQRIRAANGAQLGQQFGLVKGLEQMRVPEDKLDAVLRALWHNPNIVYAEPDWIQRPVTNDTYYGLQWGLENIGQTINSNAGTPGADVHAPEAWTTTTGSGAFIVAVIDTGTQYTHPDLAANMWQNVAELNGVAGVDDDGNGFVDDIQGWDFYANDNDPDDSDGHGTHCAGVIGAVGNNGMGVAGINWQCRIMPLRFLGPAGGSTTDAILALQYAVQMGALVSNNSWGGGGYSSALHDAIQSAGAQGHVFVAAAGNDGVNTDTSPHYPSSYNLPNLISVAATDNRDGLASFSNYGAVSVDLGAPGVDIASTYKGSGYVYMSGTSMATPHVTGVTALLYGYRTGWSADQVVGRILQTVRPIPSLAGKTVTGGVLQADVALQDVGTPPAAPSNLAATAVSGSEIQLVWDDNAADETGYTVERSPDAATWEQAASLGVDSVSFLDGGLSADTTYHYRVCARNASGNSDYSNVATATTVAVPTVTDDLASADLGVTGDVVGSYVDTQTLDGVAQAISEVESGGKPSKRYSQLEHRWRFDVAGGGAVTFFVSATATVSSDGDSFQFEYSSDDVTYHPMLLVNSQTDIGSALSFALPATTRGALYVRVVDTDHTPGNRSVDTVYVDQLVVRSESAVGDPPNAPSGLSATVNAANEVLLAWTDNATDEYGFEVQRSLDLATWQTIDTVPAETTEYTDASTEPSTGYAYRVVAYNGAGFSAPSNVVEVTTAQGISLTVTPLKVKGVQSVDLAWSGASTATVEIQRDGQIIATVPNSGTYTDAIGAKGGGSYIYQVCEPNGGGCSPPKTATF